MHYKSHAGFTLVELSIVLVILGLLVGGVLTGQSLIRGAELRSTISEYQSHVAATYAFRDKYFALPGDMANATSFWGVAGGTGADDTCRNTVSTSTATCNGDGDGQVRGTGAGYANYNEQFRYWQHLSNAGLIQGRYIGTDARNSNPSNSYQIAGLNMPQSKVASNAYWMSQYSSPDPGSTGNFASAGGNNFRIASYYTPEEAWNIDTKIDDGFPGTGKMRSFKGYLSQPITTAAEVAPPADAGATYNFAYKAKEVHPWIFY